MTRREYIKELLSHVRSIGSLPGELEKSLPSPEEGSKGQEAAVKVVSNPYFLAGRKRDGAWYARVESELEDFAARIDAMLNPTEDSINEEIRQFLEELLNRNLGTDLKPGPQEKQEQEEEEEEDNEEDNEENDEIVDKEREDANSGEQNKIPDDITDLLEDLMKSIGRPDTGNEEDEEKEKENETDNEEQFGIGAGNSKEENLRRENRFLRSIPKDLLKLAKIIGRSGSVDFKPSGHFPTAAKSDITGITIGDNLSSLLPSETALLSCPATQPTFYHNYVEKRLQIFASASSGNAPVTHQDGPVIICLDTSGSMRGEKVEIACNLTMAITIIAQRRKRDVLVVKYSDWHFLLKVTKLSRQREDLEKFLSSYQGCGNAENELFRWLFKDILPNEKAFDTADILCITDFGWKPLNDYTIKLIESFKRKGMIFYGLNVLGFEKWSFDSMTTVCDSLWKWSSNHLEEMNTQKKGTHK